MVYPIAYIVCFMVECLKMLPWRDGFKTPCWSGSSLRELRQRQRFAPNLVQKLGNKCENMMVYQNCMENDEMKYLEIYDALWTNDGNNCFCRDRNFPAPLENPSLRYEGSLSRHLGKRERWWAHRSWKRPMIRWSPSKNVEIIGWIFEPLIV